MKRKAVFTLFLCIVCFSQLQASSLPVKAGDGRLIVLTSPGAMQTGLSGVHELEIFDRLKIDYSILPVQDLGFATFDPRSILFVPFLDPQDREFTKYLTLNRWRITDFVEKGGVLIACQQRFKTEYEWMPIQVKLADTYFKGDPRIASDHPLANEIIAKGVNPSDLSYSLPYVRIHGEPRIIISSYVSGAQVVWLAVVPVGNGFLVLSAIEPDSKRDTSVRFYDALIRWSREPKDLEGKKQSVSRTKIVPPKFLRMANVEPRPDLLRLVVDTNRIRDLIESQIHLWSSDSANQMIATAQGVFAMSLLGIQPSDPSRLVRMFQAYQKKDGGFNFRSLDPTLESNLQDTYYAVQALNTLGAIPVNTDATVQYTRHFPLAMRKPRGCITFTGCDHPIQDAFYLTMILDTLDAPLPDWDLVSSLLIRFESTPGIYSEWPKEEQDRDNLIRETAPEITLYALLTSKLYGKLPDSPVPIIQRLDEYLRKLQPTSPVPTEEVMIAGTLEQRAPYAAWIGSEAVTRILADTEFEVSPSDLYHAILDLTIIANLHPEFVSSKYVPASMPPPIAGNAKILLLGRADQDWDEQVLREIGVPFEKAKSHELLDINFADYPVVMISYNEELWRPVYEYPLRFDNSISNVATALGRFVQMGGILIVFPQKTYRWLPFQVSSTNTTIVGNKVWREQRHEILAGVTRLDLEGWNDSWKITFDSVPQDSQILLKTDIEGLPLLVVVNVGKGKVILSQLLADFKGVGQPGARKLLRNIIWWGVAQSHVKANVIPASQNQLVGTIRVTVAAVGILGISLLIFVESRRRKYKMVRLAEITTYVLGVVLFVMDLLTPNIFLRLAIVGLAFYDIDLQMVLGLARRGPKLRLLSSLMIVICTLLFLGFWSIVPIESMHLLFLAFALILLFTTPWILLIISDYIWKRFAASLADLADERHQFHSLFVKYTSTPDKAFVRRIAFPFYLALYMLGGTSVAVLVVIGFVAPTSVWGSSELTKIGGAAMLGGLIILWGMTLFLRGHHPADESQVLAELVPILPTPHALLYGTLWVMMFGYGILVLESYLFQLFETASVLSDAFSATLVRFPYFFFTFFYPPYLLFALGRAYQSEIGLAKEPYGTVNPFLMLFLTVLIPPFLNLKDSILSAYVGLVAWLVLLTWVSVETLSHLPEYRELVTIITPRNKNPLLVTLITAYVLGLTLQTLINIVQNGCITLASISCLAKIEPGIWWMLFLVLILCLPGLLFFLSYRWYFQRRHSGLRLILAFIAILLATLVSRDIWALSLIYLGMFATVLDLYKSLN